MPIRPPILDDRRFEDLVEEMLSRIPAHTPEWTNPRVGDPGRTMLELFAWLTDTLLYRVNLIPERQRLAFLRLLGQPLRPAQAAKGLVTVSHTDDTRTTAVHLRSAARLKGPEPFETTGELTVFPLTAQAYYKRALNSEEADSMHEVVEGLRQLYVLDQQASPYMTSPLFSDNAPHPQGFDLVTQTVDQALWLAILAPNPEFLKSIRNTLGENESGGQQILNVGIVPSIHLPTLFEEIGSRARIPHVWEITTHDIHNEPNFLDLDVIEDSTDGLTKSGVVRLQLPSASFIQAPTNNVRIDLGAGVGDRPPRLDNPEQSARLVTWLRLRPTQPVQQLALSWVGVNAVEVEQYESMQGTVIGVGSGLSDQEFQLPAQNVQPQSLEIHVEESGRGYQTWLRVEDLDALSHDPRIAREARVFTLDSESGLIRFGNGVRGRIPEQGQRVRVARLRSGGGQKGNLPAGVLSDITAMNHSGSPVTKLKVLQPLPLNGGAEAETLSQAEQRIPSQFRHRDRAVTQDDFVRLTKDTPGIQLGRVEVLPRFKPHQRQQGVPGVVSVMVLPSQSIGDPPYPRPDRPILEAVYHHLEPRRPLTTELYVIGCEYVPLGISIGLTIREGFGQESVLQAVRVALREHLWPLSPGGISGEGWGLGRPVRDRELEVQVARVAGVNSVIGINLFEQDDEGWRLLPRPQAFAPVDIHLEAWQLPELLATIVLVDEEPPVSLQRGPNPFASRTGIPIPVVLEPC